MTGRKVAFIGGGNMASAIISRMVSTWDNPACIHVADKNFEKLENLHKEFNVTTHQETGEWSSLSSFRRY